MELPDHGHEFLASLRAERGLSANTAAAYGRDLAQYRDTLDSLGTGPTPDAVRTHLQRLRDADLAASSIARKLASVRAYHRWLVAEGYSDDDPTASIASTARPSRLPKALTVEEVGRIIDGVPTSSDVGVRDRAVLELLYATGCRVSELVACDLHDLDLETRTVLLTGKGNKQRIVPVGRMAIEAIEGWLPVRMILRTPGGDPGALFLSTRGNRLGRQAVWRIVKARGVAAGVAEDRLSPHVFRHSAATHMVEGGADLRTVQEMLGHASLSTTQIYTKVSPEHLREVVVGHHPRGV